MDRFTIYGNPVTKKNHGQIVKCKGRAMVIPSKKYREYEKLCKNQIPNLQIDKPCNIKATYYMQTRRRVDITNLHSALHDVLVTHGCLVDDNCHIVVGTDGSRVAYDKENPRTEVEITYDGYTDPFS